MRVHIFTLVLDGLPYIRQQFECFSRLNCDWVWHVVEGAAANVGSTAWCRRQSPRLSRDGTTQFLNSIRKNPKVRLYQKQWWPGGKDEMANAPLVGIKEPCLLVESDVDEIWKPEQIDTLYSQFAADPRIGGALFYCRYWVGPGCLTVSRDNYGNRAKGEWARAFRFTPGMRWMSHEPPRLSARLGRTLSRDETRAHGLIFDHYSWCAENQVRYKETFYQYKGAVAGWRRLQENKSWPTALKNFFWWVEPDVIVDNVRDALASQDPATAKRLEALSFFQCDGCFDEPAKSFIVP